MSETTNIENGVIGNEDTIQNALNRKAMKKEYVGKFLPYLGIVILVVFFEVMTKGKFLEKSNIQLLLNQCFTMVIVMVGVVFMYSMGTLDMAAGGVMSLSALVISICYINNLPLLLSLVIGVIISAGCMSITALAKVYLKIDPFIASLCVMNMTTGIVSVSTKANRIVFPYSKAIWLDSTVTKIIVLIAVIAMGYIIFEFTPFSRELKAIGGGEKVAKASGIKISRVSILAYSFAGIGIGIASLFAVVRGGIADTSIGSGLPLNIIVGLVLGGFPLAGGSRSKFMAPVIGALMITALTNGLALMGQASTLGYAIRGILLIIVVSMTYNKSKGELII